MTILTTLGCKSRDPNPELRDPIYSYYLKEQATYAKEAEDVEKTFSKLEEELKKTEPRTIERKSAQKELDRAHSTFSRASQMSEYYSIRAARRKYYAKVDYDKSFQKDESWPSPKEYKNFQQNLKLNAVSRKWADRLQGESSSEDKE